jgi:hypothetical protein
MDLLSLSKSFSITCKPCLSQLSLLVYSFLHLVFLRCHLVHLVHPINMFSGFTEGKLRRNSE